ncbi:response regulator transcription factor [Bacillus sp. AK031]
MAGKIKALIVDDEARLRRGIERLLAACGEEWEVVGSYGSGTECLEAYQQSPFPFDLLITDVKMPGIDGLSLIKELKKETHFHAIVISGFDDFQFLQTAIREGASDYLIKPIDREEFQERIGKIKEDIVKRRHKEKHFDEIESRAALVPHIKQTQLLSEMIWKQDVDLSLLEWTKEFPEGNYLLMYVSPDNLVSKSKSFEKVDWKAWTFAIENILDEMISGFLSSSFKVWKWKGQDLSFWILLNVHNENSDSIEEEGFLHAEGIKSNIKKFTPFTCSIALSKLIKDLSLLPNLIQELNTCLQFRLLYGGDKIFSNEAIENVEANIDRKEHPEINHKIDKVIFYLNNHNPNATKREITSFFSTIGSLHSPVEIERAIHLLGIRVVNHLVGKTKEKDGFPLLKEIFDTTRRTANLSELRNEVYDWVKKVLFMVEKKHNSQNIDHIQSAKNWISENVDQNITIHKIAEQVYMNPTYFSEYFKSHTGETVLDYVTRIRIEKAKGLLLTTDFKIYDISVKVGYSDTKYFSRLFKKHYGEVPSKYKERMKYKGL